MDENGTVSVLLFLFSPLIKPLLFAQVDDYRKAEAKKEGRQEVAKEQAEIMALHKNSGK